jgi:hypothetical protein
MGWQKASGYGKRSLVETAFHRYKVLIGRSLQARPLSAQKVEARHQPHDQPRHAGLPQGRLNTGTESEVCPQRDLCTNAHHVRSGRLRPARPPGSGGRIALGKARSDNSLTVCAPGMIPLANSLCGFRYHEGSECRLASLGTRFTDQPAIDAAQVDGGGDQEMLQMRLRRSDITRAPQIESPDAL